jgi:HPt (histidine-containing phosphotransfer) domain-containing protein
MPAHSGERVAAEDAAAPDPAPRVAGPQTLVARAADSTAGLARSLAAADSATRARVVHSLQRSHGNASVQRLASMMVARTVTFDECSSDQEDRVLKAHKRGKSMLKRAQRKLDEYDGTDPSEVHDALQRHFNSTSTTIAWLVMDNIRGLRAEMAASFDPQYECQSEQDGSVLAWVPWCVPLADIEVYPRFFHKKDGTERSLDKQASTLIHEWFHKYACKLDVGYEHEEGYEEHGTFRHFLNADSFAGLIYDVW